MNLPNKLTVMRLIMVPVILVVLLLPVSVATNIIAAIIFLATAITDLLDGKIARKRGIVTNFGKFLDPLADKFMVIAAMVGILVRHRNESLFFNVFMLLLTVTIFRELAVASIRLVTSQSAGIVVPANLLGKVKTVSQIVLIMAALIEPLLDMLLKSINIRILAFLPITCTAALVALTFTVWSGVVYLKTYWPYLDSEK